MKKLMAVGLTVLLCLSGFTACGSGGDKGESQKEDGAASGAEFVLKCADGDSEERSINIAFRNFEKYVEEKSDGRIDVQVYPNGQLGDDKDYLEGMQVGTVEMSAMACGVLGSYDERFNLLDLPYLFEDYDSMTKAVTGELGDLYCSWMGDYGFVGLGFEYDGAKNISNNKRPINSVADMKGLKIRCMETPLYIDILNSMGANPTPMSFSEIYTALSQGTVDGQDGVAGLTYDSKFYEVSKYYSLTGHTYSNAVIVASKSFMDGLPDDLRKIVEDGAKIMKDEQREIESGKEEEFIRLIDESPQCTVNEVTDRQSFVEATASIYDDYRALVGDEVMDQVLELAGKKL